MGRPGGICGVPARVPSGLAADTCTACARRVGVNAGEHVAAVKPAPAPAARPPGRLLVVVLPRWHSPLRARPFARVDAGPARQSVAPPPLRPLPCAFVGLPGAQFEACAALPAALIRGTRPARRRLRPQDFKAQCEQYVILYGPLVFNMAISYLQVGRKKGVGVGVGWGGAPAFAGCLACLQQCRKPRRGRPGGSTRGRSGALHDAYGWLGELPPSPCSAPAARLPLHQPGLLQAWRRALHCGLSWSACACCNQCPGGSPASLGPGSRQCLGYCEPCDRASMPGWRLAALLRGHRSFR